MSLKCASSLMAAVFSSMTKGPWQPPPWPRPSPPGLLLLLLLLVGMGHGAAASAPGPGPGAGAADAHTGSRVWSWIVVRHSGSRMHWPAMSAWWWGGAHGDGLPGAVEGPTRVQQCLVAEEVHEPCGCVRIVAVPGRRGVGVGGGGWWSTAARLVALQHQTPRMPSEWFIMAPNTTPRHLLQLNATLPFVPLPRLCGTRCLPYLRVWEVRGHV